MTLITLPEWTKHLFPSAERKRMNFELWGCRGWGWRGGTALALGEDGDAANEAKERVLHLLDLAECLWTSPDDGDGEPVCLETVVVASKTPSGRRHGWQQLQLPVWRVTAVVSQHESILTFVGCRWGGTQYCLKFCTWALVKHPPNRERNWPTRNSCSTMGLKPWLGYLHGKCLTTNEKIP